MSKNLLLEGAEAPVLNRRYILGLFWFLMSLLISVGNDLMMKGLGCQIEASQVVFFRFLFSALTLVPVILWQGAACLKTQRLDIHVLRGALLYAGISLWCFGLLQVPMAAATAINFTIPLFTLILAIYFLKERVGMHRWIATLAGFIGVFVIIDPTHVNFNPASLWLLVAAVMFAGLDILNKRFVIQETMVGMLFYSSVVTTILGAYPAWQVYQSVDMLSWGLLVLLGAGANLLLFCLLKGLSYFDASATAPLRYFEVVISTIAGYYFFSEIPSIHLLMGVAIIVPSTLYVTYTEVHAR